MKTTKIGKKRKSKRGEEVKVTQYTLLSRTDF